MYNELSMSEAPETQTQTPPPAEQAKEKKPLTKSVELRPVDIGNEANHPDLDGKDRAIAWLDDETASKLGGRENLRVYQSDHQGTSLCASLTIEALNQLPHEETTLPQVEAFFQVDLVAKRNGGTKVRIWDYLIK